jgi:high-affinity iron transporter
VIALILAVSAARALGMIGYVAGDYATAVSPGGAVIDKAEFDEQVLFVSEAASDLAGSLDISKLQSLVAAHASPSVVVPLARSVESQIEARFQLAVLPPRAPRDASRLYAQACAACHSPVRRDLTTVPPDLADKNAVAGLTPRRIFSAITYGVPGTAMPSYEEGLTLEQRWDLAYYVLSMSHSAAAELKRGRQLLAKLPRRPDYLQLAVRSDDQLRKTLAGSGLSPSDREAILSACRH